ncbi:LysM peptidoglycan-binding domain-containing protein, partial [Arachnia propionica]|uniref:LysM peptidoglycan-binding domain-containing protein n=1 Tax=Arachnia propionica TaxID=1750 RepID=UPI00242BDF4E
MRRVATAIAAALLLVVLLLGVPWLLLCWGWLAELATINWGSVFLRPDDGRITLGVLSLAGWLAWAMLALTTAGELLHTISRGRIRFRVPGTGWLRPVIALLVTAALSPVLTANAFSSPPDAPAAITAPAKIRPEDSATPSHTARQEPTGWREYEVQPGDELWDIAARELGAGERWRQLVAANPGIDIDHPPPPGTILRLPMTVRVERGDSLWHLAERHLGDPERWPELHEANRDRISDPDEIDTGWVLTLPGADVAAPGAQPRPAQPTVTVEPAPTPTPSPPPEATPT